MSRGNCGECLHAQMGQQLGATALFCHAEPAKLHVHVLKDGGMQMFGLWPPVAKGDHCAKFEPDPLMGSKRQ